MESDKRVTRARQGVECCSGLGFRPAEAISPLHVLYNRPFEKRQHRNSCLNEDYMKRG